MQDGKDDGKKRRGPVSCAECRRLKLKCDRKLPCSSCLKRGCAAICPNGMCSDVCEAFVLADTKQLHAKIEAMSKRIGELEDALAAVQAKISHEKHPLLADKLMMVKAPPPTQNVTAAMNEPVDKADEMAERFGTLTLGDRAHFFGQHAAADVRMPLFPKTLSTQEEGAPDIPTTASSLPLDILLLSNEFPMANISEARETVLSLLASWVPSAPQAWDLIELYYREAAWLFLVITKEDFTESIFARIYADAVPSVADITPHELALFFMLLCIACMSDMRRPPYNVDASNYYQLARAAVGLDSVIDHPTLNAIRAIHLMSMYAQMCEQLGSATTVYILNGLNAQLCQSLGLHRDDTQWKLPERDQQNRRHLFWEVATYDLYASIGYGRPPSFTMAHVDAQVPAANYKFIGPDAERLASFRVWNHTFTQKVLFKVMDEAFGVAPLTYAAVMRLDRLVREHPLPEDMRIEDVGEPQTNIPTWLLLQRSTIFGLTQKLLLFLHRTFFARALAEHPADPLQSKYAQSVLTAFRSALYISAGVRAMYAQAPIVARFWVFLSQSFSACLVLGSIVIKAPGCGLAPPAWAEFERLYQFLEQAAPMSRRTARIMPNVRKLRAVAQEVYTAFTAASGAEPRHMISDVDEKEFWSLFGHSRLVDNANKSSPSSAGENTSPESASSAPPTQAQTSVPALPMDTTAPIDDMLAALYSSYWPSTDGQSHAQQEAFWNMDVAATSSGTYDMDTFPTISASNGDASLSWQAFLSSAGFDASQHPAGAGPTNPVAQTGPAQ
ncbi:hypothetical protein AURDEDRAFT_86868 [Auricularia subglabra TFB-10046 SS5]|nr:hypothetical protein AURDEDRAFT_86868 [Auricularia subglabra TFB-10046 SS5]